MPLLPRTFSFKDVTFIMAGSVAGDFAATGQNGVGQMSVEMALDRSVQDVAADGTVMVSYISGNNGQITLEVQQTSIINGYLTNWYNALVALAESGDVTLWAASTITIRSITDGGQHVATGVSPGKLPHKPYAAQGQRITWTLMCADIQTNVTL